MKVAILQSNYIPWKGVFDMINMVDTFVFFEDVDFTKRDWRTRNYIKTANGLQLLSIPVVKAERGTKIKDIVISQEVNWQEKHFESIVFNYKKAPYFDYVLPLLEDIYLNHKWTNLSEMNIYITKKIASLLGCKTTFVNSKDLHTQGTKDDKLIEICEKLGADAYLSGPAAKDYIWNEKFCAHNIGLSYIEYDYPEYKQLWGDFEHHVSILDVLFNCGPNAAKYVFQGKEEIVQ